MPAAVNPKSEIQNPKSTAVRVLVLRAAGTNCDRETCAAFAMAGAAAEPVHINRLLREPELLKSARIAVVPGGFTYGDDLGAGKVLANQIRRRLLDPFREFIMGGGLLLGICNGFQVLVKAGLLPDPFEDEPAATLGWNDSNRFEARWVHLKVCSEKSEFIKEERILRLPVAHGEGKFLPRDDGVLRRLQSNGQVVLRYCDPGGRPGGYPDNPNGSVDEIAGICDPTGRVLGLMPHPERFTRPTHHPAWTRFPSPPAPDGLRFFTTAVEYAKHSMP